MAVQIARLENGHLVIDTETFGKILDKIGTMPVAVVAVSGPQDCGKSCIINQLLRHLTSSNDPGDNRCNTAGSLLKTMTDQHSHEILLWPEPLIASRVAVLLMVIHGSVDVMTTLENSLILSFSCLLSFVMIYNVQRDFSEDILRFLHMTVANAKGICQQDDYVFGKLLVIVNDRMFYPGCNGSELLNGQGSSTVINLKDKLNNQSGLKPEARVVRQEILSSFQDVACCLIMQPSKNMDCSVEVPDNDPLQDITKWVFAENISKKVRGKEITGFEYKALMVKWAGMFSGLILPPASTTAEAQAEVQSAEAYSVALKYFRHEMVSIIDELNDLSDDQVCHIHANKARKTAAMFERLSHSADRTVQQKYEDMLKDEMLESLYSYLRMNSEERSFNPEQMVVPPERTVMVHKITCERMHLKNFCIAIIVIIAIAVIRYIILKALDSN